MVDPDYLSIRHLRIAL